jgi:hypothetical protein
MLNATLWKLFRSSWQAAPTVRTPGYSVLLAVPADLPVFLKIAMATINAQQNDGLIETLVIPDMPTDAFEQAYERAKAQWTNGPIRLVKLRPVERFITRRINSPHTNHWLQMVNGAEAATSTYALLHDADLFITDKSFLAGHYAAMKQRDLACLGINPVWDKWYAENGLSHVTATWELLFNIEWARSFAAWMHRGHNGTVNGKEHEFDTMLLPQCLTPADRIARHQGDWGFVHFNYVICTYRWFQEADRAGKGPYQDEFWRILLIRLLADAYESSETEADVPGLAELEKGLRGESRRVDYRGDKARTEYPEFRAKLQQLIESGILDERKIRVLEEGIDPFDAAMGWAHSTRRVQPVLQALA